MIPKKQDKTIKINVVYLHNKSRKGRYWYIKQPKKPGRYYKHHYQEIKPILQHYKENIKYKYGGKSPKIRSGKAKKVGKKKFKRYGLQKKLKKKQQTKKLKTIVKKSKISKTIPNLLQATNQDINRLYKNLMQELINKKDHTTLLKVISTEHNINKLKSRIHNRLIIYNENNEETGTLTKIGSTPKQVLNDIKQEIIKYEEGGLSISNVIKNLQNKKYTWTPKKKEIKKIKKIKYEIIFNYKTLKEY